MGFLVGFTLSLLICGMHVAAGDTEVRPSREIIASAGAESTLTRAREALAEMGGRNITEAGNTLRATLPVTWRSFGEVVVIQVTENDECSSQVLLQSRPRVRTTVFDYGKNQANINALSLALQKNVESENAT